MAPGTRRKKFAVEYPAGLNAAPAATLNLSSVLAVRNPCPQAGAGTRLHRPAGASQKGTAQSQGLIRQNLW